jgi:hypothetical protein
MWSDKCIGMTSVITAGNRLAVFYDAPGDYSNSNMKRNIGLVRLDLPSDIPNAKNFSIALIPVQFSNAGETEKNQFICVILWLKWYYYQ